VFVVVVVKCCRAGDSSETWLIGSVVHLDAQAPAAATKNAGPTARTAMG